MALDGLWVELTVDAQDWSIREVTQEEADAWWEDNKPDPIDVSPMNTDVTGLWDDVDLLDLETYDLKNAIQAAVPVFGGKGSHFGGLALIEDFPNPSAYVIPVHYYNQHMETHGLWAMVDEMLSSKEFSDDPAVRDQMLEDLRDAIIEAPIDQDLVDMVSAHIIAGEEAGRWPSTRVRFRSSTNAEDVNGFNGAGLYTSKSGDPNDDDDPVEDAMREVWASVWSFRAFEEREYYSIEHRDIGMALLSHMAFRDEEANGVAITNNVYDTTGLEPAFYVNVQLGEESVVQPDEGVTTDQFLYYYSFPNQPVVYIGHSNLIADGESVLTNSQIYALGTALSDIHMYFFEVYGASGGWYGMDVEFKFDDVLSEDGELELFVKQARPYPGWGSVE